MIHNVYAVKDELQCTFLSPIYAESDALAIRDFKFKVNNIEQWKYSSGDYSLYRLGTFDDSTGFYNSNVEKLQSGRAVLDD